MPRVVEYLLGWTMLDTVAALEHIEVVRHLTSNTQVVCNEHHRDVKLVTKISK
nr:hypothetical protein [Rhodococcus erythropolis]